MAWDPTDYKDMLDDDWNNLHQRLISMLDEQFFGGVYIEDMLRQASKILGNPKVVGDAEFEKLVDSQEAEIEELAKYLMDNYYLTPIARKKLRMKNMKENVNEAFDERGLTKDQLTAVHILEDAGLNFVSSPVQIKHGTLMFKDPMLDDVGYSITKSGYARRYIADTYGNLYGAKKKSNLGRHYQLNKKAPEGQGGFETGMGYIPSRIRRPGDYVGLAKDILKLIEKYRQKNIKDYKPEEPFTFENIKPNISRAKTVNE